MIVKHENRIRALEARAAEDCTDKGRNSGDGPTKNNDHKDIHDESKEDDLDANIDD